MGHFRLFAAILVFSWPGRVLPAESPTEIYLRSIKPQAENLYREKSYALARDLYLKADLKALSSEEGRWVRFRLADTLWRSAVSTQVADQTDGNRAVKELNALHGQIRDPDQGDRVWAETHESLGDYYHLRGYILRDYRDALGWWMLRLPVEEARNRFLDLLLRAAEPPPDDSTFFFQRFSQYEIPREVLDRAVALARNREEGAVFHFLLARSLEGVQDAAASLRAGEEYEAAYAALRKLEDEHVSAAIQAGNVPGAVPMGWRDDVLYHYAGWLKTGVPVKGEDDVWRRTPDYERAYRLLNELVASFPGSPYLKSARAIMSEVNRRDLSLEVDRTFLPGMPVSFLVRWCNITHIDFTLRSIDLALALGDKGTRWSDYMSTRMRLPVRLPPADEAQIVKRWSLDTADTIRLGNVPRQKEVAVEGELAPGAYLLVAYSPTERESAEALILVTDAAIVLKTSRERALAYFCSARDGSPIDGGSVALTNYHQKAISHTTDGDGLAVFPASELPSRYGDRSSGPHEHVNLVAVAGSRQAFATGYAGEHRAWRYPAYLYFHAVTDRPAYRPGETVNWKVTARRWTGSRYETPVGHKVRLMLTGPKGNLLHSEEIVLDRFGSAWGSFPLSTDTTLGYHAIVFSWTRIFQGRSNSESESFGFQVEEYRLPEYEVSVTFPRTPGVSFKPGEVVKAQIEVRYLSGGPVAGTEVSVGVSRRRFLHSWAPLEDSTLSLNRGEYSFSGWIDDRVTTNAEGKAVFTFAAQKDERTDWEYQVWARVGDLSRRRPVVGNGIVRVTRAPAFISFLPERRLVEPGKKTAIAFTAVDADDRPVKITGRIRVLRLQTVPKDSGERMRVKEEEVLSLPAALDEQGRGSIEITLPSAGCYRFIWEGTDPGPSPVHRDTRLYALTPETTDIGFVPEELTIIADRESYAPGERARILVLAPFAKGFVLFTQEGEQLEAWQLLRFAGTAALVEVEVQEKFLPNVSLAASAVRDGRLHQTLVGIRVLPPESRLSVAVAADREEYRPGEKGKVAVQVTDGDGKPVEAQVALAVADESVWRFLASADLPSRAGGTYRWEPDPRGNPWQRFYGGRREHGVALQHSFQADRLGLFAWSSAELRRRQEARERSRGRQALMVEPVPASVPVKLDVRPEEVQQRQDTAGGSGSLIRRDFRTTALWAAGLVTGPDGNAAAEVTFPESLTAWRLTARGVGQGNRFGMDEGTARTSLPLTVRLQAPRFFVAGDRVTVSAVIGNTTNREVQVTPALEVGGVVLLGRLTAGKLVSDQPRLLAIPPGGSVRADWLVEARAPGRARLKASAAGSGVADAEERYYPVEDHGIEKLVARTGKMRGDRLGITFDLPRERRPGSTTLAVTVAPSPAAALLDALPYLIRYPYGCTEQTLSRFVPAVVVLKTMKDLGIPSEKLAERIFGGIEPSSTGTTHPEGKTPLEELDRVVEAGLQRLGSLSHGDGSWGWWTEREPDPFMSAYALWGLVLAREAGVRVPTGLLSSGARYLRNALDDKKMDLDLRVFVVHALTAYAATAAEKEEDQTMARIRKETVGPAIADLYEKREELNAYARALLALAAHYAGDREKAAVLARNLANGAIIDREPEDSALLEKDDPTAGGLVTAHWGDDGIVHRWSQGGVEATAFVLKALLAIEPESPLVEQAAVWLITNRRSTQWKSTRDTAIAVLALVDYLRVTRETATEGHYELSVNGRSAGSADVGKGEALFASHRFEIDATLLRDGRNECLLRRTSGTGPLYLAAEARYYSREEPVAAQGNELFVQRTYQRIDAQGKAAAVLEDGSPIHSSDLVEEVLTLEAKNNLEYILVEDLKPGGFEALEEISGEGLVAKELTREEAERRFIAGAGAGKTVPEPVNPGGYTKRNAGIYRELRDRKVALFLRDLPQGFWEIRYRFRAEVPGFFHGLPAVGQAMYVPEIRGNSQETRVTVGDRPSR